LRPRTGSTKGSSLCLEPFYVCRDPCMNSISAVPTSPGAMPSPCKGLISRKVIIYRFSYFSSGIRVYGGLARLFRPLELYSFGLEERREVNARFISVTSECPVLGVLIPVSWLLLLFFPFLLDVMSTTRAQWQS